jgi:hypothetical protein
VSTLRDVLTAVTGVWEGTYTHLTPAGGLIESFASRQETRLEGGDWYERVIYRPSTPEAEILDFRGRFTPDGDMVMADSSFEGRSMLVGDRYLLFPYRWLSHPSVDIVELIVLATSEYRTRVWQRFNGGRLDRVTVIEEQFRPDQTPAVWH